jgi:VPS62-like protein
MRAATLVGLVAAALVVAPAAGADLSQERALAERYAPVVRLVEPGDACGPGKPYTPIDVDALFGQPTVALRGPWSSANLVKIGPSATDLAKGLFEYHLDFPGDALHPGCTYLEWERRITAGREPTAYAHVVTDPTHPGKLALQYWFFYVFNDWNNLHEGDWEMIQLVFDASTAEEALAQKPVEVGYSQHEGAERAAWDADKLGLVDGTHPVVYPADGSHANFYGEGLYLGSSASEGVGCDDTRGPHLDVRPAVRTISSDPEAARAEFPWIAYDGRWGELQPAFFNGPEGPNLKTQWTQPITWAEESWRDHSYTVPGGSLFGPNATDFFCGAIAHGSRSLVQLVANPVEFSLVVGALALLVLFLFSRTTWRPAAPLRIAHRRSWGQTLSASARMYASRFGLFVGIGLLFVPIAFLVSLLQGLVLHATNVLGVQSAGGRSGSFLSYVVLAIGTSLTLLALGLVMAATARALVEIDEGRTVGPIRAYRLAFDSIRPLFTAVLIAALVVSLLTSTIFLLPVAIWLAGRWALIAPVVELEGVDGLGALGRSARLVRRRWLKVTSLIVAGAAVVLVLGPLIGALLILGTNAPLWLVNIVAGVIYAVTMPFVALTTAYVYFDARVRNELGAAEVSAVLPAEIGLSS